MEAVLNPISKQLATQAIQSRTSQLGLWSIGQSRENYRQSRSWSSSASCVRSLTLIVAPCSRGLDSISISTSSQW